MRRRQDEINSQRGTIETREERSEKGLRATISDTSKIKKTATHRLNHFISHRQKTTTCNSKFVISYAEAWKKFLVVGLIGGCKLHATSWHLAGSSELLARNRYCTLLKDTAQSRISVNSTAASLMMFTDVVCGRATGAMYMRTREAMSKAMKRGFRLCLVDLSEEHDWRSPRGETETASIISKLCLFGSLGRVR